MDRDSTPRPEGIAPIAKELASYCIDIAKPGLQEKVQWPESSIQVEDKERVHGMQFAIKISLLL